jgi:hypothetical protein
MDKTNIICFGEKTEGTKATNPKKTVLSSIPGDAFCTLETNEIRRRQIRTAMFISSWGLQEQTPQH